jgi:hypothetical protein
MEWIVALFIVMGTTQVLRGPVGKALGDRIAGRRPGAGADGAGTDQVLGEVDALRARVAELEERLDFAERMLARQREQPPLERGA